MGNFCIILKEPTCTCFNVRYNHFIYVFYLCDWLSWTFWEPSEQIFSIRSISMLNLIHIKKALYCILYHMEWNKYWPGHFHNSNGIHCYILYLFFYCLLSKASLTYWEVLHVSFERYSGLQVKKIWKKSFSIITWNKKTKIFYTSKYMC